MPFLDEVERLFGTRDLYEVLEIQRDADDNTIRRSYYRLALRFHPDRSTEEETTEKFQTLSRINEILSDAETRGLYDDTGEVDDDSVPSDRDWTEYWRLLYKKISEEDVRQFHEGYKGSEEEMEDLKAAYLAGEGDMDKIMDTVLCASVLDDEERFREILGEWIEEGDVPKYKAYAKETKAKRERRRKRAVKEAEEAKALLAEIGQKRSKDMDSDLSKAIKKRGKERQQEMKSFFDDLEKKYTGGGEKGKRGKGKKGKAAKEDTDEIVEPKVTMRKRKANPETSEPPKKEASKQKKQGASSRAKKRAKKMEDVEEEDDEMNGVTAVKEDSKAPVSVIVTKMTDKTSPSDDINQDKDIGDGVKATRSKQVRKKAPPKKQGKKEEPVESDSEQVDEKPETQTRKRELRKPKVEDSKQGKAAGRIRNRRKQAEEPEIEEPYLISKASLRVSRVKVGKKMKLFDATELDDFEIGKTTEETDFHVKTEMRKKAKPAAKAAPKTKKKTTKLRA